jgi:diguanylate cyclase (GGDEF)-like protein/PAS domain S-box-containing protein
LDIELLNNNFAKIAAGRPITLRRSSAAIVLLFLLAIWGVAYYEVTRSEANLIEQSEIRTQQQSRALAEFARSNFKRIDELLLDFRAQWGNDRKTFGQLIQKRKETISDIAFQVGVIDRDGFLAFSNLAPATEKTDLHEREHFKVHALSQSADQLFISKPVKGKVSGKWSIQFTRPIFKGEQFDGVMVVSADPTQFVDLGNSLGVKESGTAAMVRETGEIMARYPNGDEYLGTLIKGTPFLGESATRTGTFRRYSNSDSVERVFGYYRMPDYGVTFSIGESVEEALLPNASHRNAVLSIALITSALICFLFYQLLRSISAIQKLTIELSDESKIAKQANTKLELAASVFEHAREGITITDSHGTIVDVNESFTRITGYTREEVIGKNPRILSSGRQDPAFYADMWGKLNEQGHWSGEVWNRRKDGEVYAELLTISAVRDIKGQPHQFVALFTDITAIKAHQSQLEHIAHFDALTHLPNRLLLADRLRHAMAQALRREQHLAVAYLDLDGFKAVNDHHGHSVGDQLLMTLASALNNTLREGDTLARLGGDEFVAVLIDLKDVESCAPMLSRLLDTAAAPYPMGQEVLQVSASIGVAFYPQDSEVDADQLMRQADQAMYQAKLAGKNRYHIFDPTHDSTIRARHEGLERVKLALSHQEFVLHYQPKVNMRSGQVVGAEALIRWQHPEKGLLAPNTFLPAIEDHALGIKVGEWVIDTALTQIEVWRTSGMDLPVSVNIGALQLQQVDFVQRLKAILARHPQVDPSSLELEVLETSALSDIEQVSQVIEDCAQIGVKFALDDFGTGYSSLTYLKRLRVATLKIDQSFVRDMLDDPDDLAILEGVIGLAGAFKREVIAEGVETVAHGTALMQLGCELAQGYGIARPMPAEQMPAWASTWRPDVAWSELPWLGDALDSRYQ